MAPVGESIVCVPTAFNSGTYRNPPVNCQLCEELSLELHKAQQELLSYGKVIQVLREELTNIDRRARPDAINQKVLLEQCFPTAGPRPGTGPWHQLYRATRGKYFIVEIF
jgi:hypothetical protein